MVVPIYVFEIDPEANRNSELIGEEPKMDKQVAELTFNPKYLAYVWLSPTVDEDGEYTMYFGVGAKDFAAPYVEHYYEQLRTVLNGV